MPSLGIAPPREAAAGHCSPCRTRRRRFRASFRRAFTCTFWRLGFRQSSFRRVTRAPRRLAPYAWARAPVSWHALVPVHLSAAGQPSDPEINLQSLPARREIRPSASWRRLGGPHGEVPAERVLFRAASRRTGLARFRASGSPVITPWRRSGTPSTVSALCISHTFRSRWCPNHLCPFALRSALPSPWPGVIPATTTGTLSPQDSRPGR